MPKRTRYRPGRKYNTKLWKLRDDRTGFPILSKDAVRDGNKPELIVHKDVWEPFLNARLPIPAITVELPDPARPFSDPSLGNIQYCYLVYAGNGNGSVVGVSCSSNQFWNRNLANQSQVTQYCPVANSSLMLYSNAAVGGTFLGTISAYDPNNQTLAYSMLNANTTSTIVTNSTQFFNVNSQFGSVNFLTTAGFDFNATYNINYQVLQTTGPSMLGNVNVVTVAPITQANYITIVNFIGPTSWWGMNLTSGNSVVDSGPNNNPLLLAAGSSNFVTGHNQLFPHLPGKSIFENTGGFISQANTIAAYNFTTALSAVVATQCTTAHVATEVLIARYSSNKAFEFSFDFPTLLTLRLAANGAPSSLAATIQANLQSIGIVSMANASYVGFTYQGGQFPTVALYANGQSLSTTVTGNIPTSLNTNLPNIPITVGCDGSLSNPFFGDLQGAIVFNKTLSPLYMTALYNSIR